MHSLTFELEYFPEQPNQEYYINVWTSASRSWYTLKRLSFRNKNSNSSKKINITVLFTNIKCLRPDTNIWFSLMKKVEPEVPTNHYGLTINGHCCLSLHSILSHMGDEDTNLSKYTQLEVIMNNQIMLSNPSTLLKYMDQKTGEFKIRKGWLKVGNIQLSIEKREWVIIQLPLEEKLYNYNETKFISGIMSLQMIKNNYIFIGKLGSNDTNMVPLNKEVASAHSVFWSSQAGYIPTSLYWVEISKHEYDEMMVLNLGDLVLSRYNKTRNWFIQEVEKQYLSRDKYISSEFRLCISIITEMACYPATILPYTGDYIDLCLKTSNQTTTNKKVFASFKEDFVKVPSDIFDDPFKGRTDDCDGLSKAIYHVSYILERGIEKYKDENIYYKRKGSWNSKFLRKVQKVLSELYVTGGQIALVTAARLDNEKKGPKKIYIDSEKDMNVEVGGHMLNIWTPVKYMSDCVKTANPCNELPLLRDKQEFYPWEDDLPCAIGEGTNMLSPLQMSISDYYPSFQKKERQKAVEEMDEIIMMRKDFLKFNKDLSPLLRWNREQTNTIGEPNIRINSFYRNFVHMYTSKYLDAGYDFCNFTWASKDLNDKNYESPFVYGIHTRQWLYKEKNVVLLSSPSITDKEAKVAKTFLRQLSPRVCPFDQNKYDVDYIYNNEERKTSFKIDEKLTDLNNKFKNISGQTMDRCKETKYMEFYLDTSLIITERNNKFDMETIYDRLECYVEQRSNIKSIEFNLEKVNKYLDTVKMRIYYQNN